MSIVAPADRLVDHSTSANLAALYDLVDELMTSDRFRRLTAYAIVKTLIDQLHDSAASLGREAAISATLAEVRAQAGALAGVAFAPQAQERHRQFYLSHLGKLRNQLLDR